MMVVVPPTVRVPIRNLAMVDPAGTVTLSGRFTASPLDKDTTAPPAGAAPVSVAVPVTRSPPTTLGALSDIDESETPATGVICICGDD